jgi:zinc transport system substrate-binding protein
MEKKAKIESLKRFEVKVIWITLLVIILFAGCKKGEKPSSKNDIQIFVSNYPLAYFAKTICGNSEKVLFPEIDDDPVFWEPSISDITAMQKADVVLINGATYEKWMDKVSLSKGRLINTSASFRDRYILTEHAQTHSHGPTGEHSHTGTAFTTWIDFTQAVQQAEATKDALISAQIGPKEKLEDNYEQLKSQLLSVDASFEAITKGNSEVLLFASHPVYQYFARRYQLNIKSVLWEPDGLPDEAMWKELEKLHHEHGAAWMIWEDEPLPESIKRLGEMGIQSVVFNPCGNRPEQGDFMTVMNSNVENLRLIFAGNS